MGEGGLVLSVPLQSLSAVVQIDFQQKEAELFAPQSILPWFAWDTKLGSLTLHLDSTQTFAAEVYAYTMGLQVFIFLCMASFVHSCVCCFSPLIVLNFACSCTHVFIQPFKPGQPGIMLGFSLN